MPAGEPAALPGPAYAALLGFYLRHGCISRHPRTFSLRVSCDRGWTGILDDVESCIRTVHPKRRTYRVPGPGVFVVQSYRQRWPCLFPQHGPGRQHDRQLRLTRWQQHLVETHTGDFLRGLFHSDGCRTRTWAAARVRGDVDPTRTVSRRWDCPRRQFVSPSEDILRWTGKSLDAATGVKARPPWPRPIHDLGTDEISNATRRAIRLDSRGASA